MSTNQRQLGKYKLLETVGRGTIDEVWRAFDTQEQRYVAIKIFHVNQQTASDFMSRFLHEAQTLASLHHPNIIQVLDFQVTQATSEAYIVMDYIEGQTLADYIHATSHLGKFPPAAEIIRLLTPIGAAIDYAHQQGIIHVGIKPTSILLARQNATSNLPGEPKLIGPVMNQTQRSPMPSLTEMRYLSPEVAQGDVANERSDIYSLGVILYEMYTGVLPFQGDTQNAVLRQHIYAKPSSPALRNPQIPPALTAIIMRSLSKDPTARFATATALVTAVANALNMSQQATMNNSNSVNVTPSSQVSLPVDVSNSPTYLSSVPQYLSPRTPSPDVANRSFSQSPPPPVIASSTPSAMPMTPASMTAGTPTSTEMNRPSPSSPALSSSGPALAPRPGDSPPSQAPMSPVPPSAPHPRGKKQQRRGLYIALIVLLIVVLLGAGLAATFLYIHNATLTAQTPIVGHAFFVSSGILGENSDQGIADKVQIDLQNIPDPHPGKSYYAWLLADNDNQINIAPIPLGVLSLNHGHVATSYPGDSQHTDLLTTYSRFLITEEDASSPPSNPSPDPTTWRYYAAFSQVPNPEDTTNHYSLLNHLRHLLAQDPKLKLVGLNGGLDIWLFRNMQKILEWSGSARDAHQRGDAAFIHRQVIRILDYLDGAQYIQTENLPAGTPLLVDQTIARVSLLEFNELQQEPPGYLKHIGNHLREIVQSPGVTADQRALAIQINKAINNVQGWLDAVHADASQLVHMSNDQLLQPATLSILNHMFTQANYAFVGQIDPNTNQVKEGVVQIHYNDQKMATFDITMCTSSNTANPCQNH